MAQPSELSQSRTQPEHLDSSLIELHAPPSREQQQQHLQQQPALQLETGPPPTYTDDANTGRGCTHPVSNGARHVSAGGDDESSLDGGSTTANSHLNNRVPTDVSAAEWTDDPYGNRHETRYDGDSPLLTSPPMSNAQQPQGPRQPVSYPSPTSYPPAGMAPTAHYAFPPQPIPQPDHYRQAPTSLPSMRTLEHVPSQQPQHQPHAIPMNAHMAGPMGPAPPMGYYGVPAHAYNMHADPNAMRFAIPPGMADPRIALSGGRHKKEIKRRTKTGCLTCRKRRIKCDEAHPTCNNCKKSKRDCLGYDPIFKQQQQQGPTVIQPAPNSQTAAPVSTLASTPTLPSTAAQPYQAQPPVVPSSYPPSVPSSITFDSPVSSTAQSVKTESGYDYSSAIDPALQGADLSTGADSPSSQYRQVKLEGLEEDAAGRQYPKAKKMKVDELIALGGFTPPTSSSPPSASVIDECMKIYNEIYGPGLSLFFESKWYELQESSAGSSNPAAAIRENQQILALLTTFIKTINGILNPSSTELTYSNRLESCVVWALARLPGSLFPGDEPVWPHDAVPVEDNPLEAWHRVTIYETLVSGGTLEVNPFPPPSPGAIDPARKRELEFWYYLGEYLRQNHSSPSAADTAAREQALRFLRSLLDGRENRDVLYSTAVLREYTARWDAALNEQTAPSHLDETDPRCKLAVATRFIRDMGASTGGTTNVVRRMAEVVYMSFVRPGANTNRPGTSP